MHQGLLRHHWGARGRYRESDPPPPAPTRDADPAVARQLFDASYPVDVPNPRMIRAKLNMAENFLLAHPLARSSSKAIISVVEPDPTISPDSPAYLPSTHLRTLTFAQLYDEVHVFSNALKAMGVGPGDRVVAFSPSNAECVVACLATAALGGIWSSCPTEFGVTAVLERFQQIEPKVLLTADRNRYAGKAIYIYDKLVAVAKELPSVQTIIVVGHMEKDREPREKFPADRLGKDWMTYGAALKKGVTKEKDIKFHRGSAMAPVYGEWILLSIGLFADVPCSPVLVWHDGEAKSYRAHCWRNGAELEDVQHFPQRIHQGRHSPPILDVGMDGASLLHYLVHELTL